MTTQVLSRRDAFVADFVKNQSYLAGLLPAGTDPERFARIVQTEVVTNPKLLDCDKTSLLQACALAARSGLEIGGGSMAQAHLIPRKGKACFETSYKGDVALAMRSGAVAGCTTAAVHQFDKLWKEDDQHHHRANLQGDRGDIVGYIAFAKLTTGYLDSEYMRLEEINDVRDKYAYDKGRKGPWKDSPGEMRRKTVLKRLLKRVPFSTEQAALLSDIDAQTPIEAVQMVEQGHPGTELGVGGLESRLALANQQESDEEPQAAAATPDESPTPQEPAQSPSERALAKANPTTIASVHMILKEAGFDNDLKKVPIYRKAIRKLFSLDAGLSDLSQGQCEALARNLRMGNFLAGIVTDLEQEAHERETGGKGA